MIRNFRLVSFSLRTLNISLHSLLACMVYEDKLYVSLFFFENIYLAIVDLSVGVWDLVP